LHLEAVTEPAKMTQQTACEWLDRARELAKCGLEDVRMMLLGLRPKSLEGTRLSGALRQLAGRFSLDCGVQCTFSMSEREHNLPEEVENELYRVAQEALCNVRKHSRAASVCILLSYNSGGVSLGIKDNGQGFAPAQPQPGAHGLGLPAMRDRARNLGAKIDINAAPGTGTEIRVSVPLSDKTSKKRSHQ